MTVQADDFKVGRWYAIESENAMPYQEEMSPFGVVRRASSCVDGMPFVITAISLPFLAVSDGRRSYSLDSREYKLIRLSPQYVRELRRYKGAQRHSGEVVQEAVPMEGHCPLCTARIRQMYGGESIWRLACPECKFVGEVPKTRKR